MAEGDDSSTIWQVNPIAEGEWAGWCGYTGDPFEDLAGPFYWRKEESGEVVCAFRAERRHMNGSGNMHGGCLLTFVDYAIFMIARDVLIDAGSVTASMNAEFVDGSQEGDLIEIGRQIAAVQLDLEADQAVAANPFLERVRQAVVQGLLHVRRLDGIAERRAARAVRRCGCHSADRGSARDGARRRRGCDRSADPCGARRNPGRSSGLSGHSTADAGTVARAARPAAFTAARA